MEPTVPHGECRDSEGGTPGIVHPGTTVSMEKRRFEVSIMFVAHVCRTLSLQLVHVGTPIKDELFCKDLALSAQCQASGLVDYIWRRHS